MYPLRIYLATVFVMYGGVYVVWTLKKSGLFQVQNWEVELYNVSHNIDIKVPLTLSIFFFIQINILLLLIREIITGIK